MQNVRYCRYNTRVVYCTGLTKFEQVRGLLVTVLHAMRARNSDFNFNHEPIVDKSVNSFVKFNQFDDLLRTSDEQFEAR